VLHSRPVKKKSNPKQRPVVFIGLRYSLLKSAGEIPTGLFSDRYIIPDARYHPLTPGNPAGREDTMANIDDFSLKDMVELSASLRRTGSGAASMEEVAGKIVHILNENLTEGKSHEKTCVLVRFFKTHSYSDLDGGLQEFARTVLKAHPGSTAMKCLVLLATAGLLPEWNSRNLSRGHKVIPLPSSEYFVKAFPMVGQLVEQMGLDVNTVLSQDAAVVADMTTRTFNVFLVPEAKGSVYIPAQNDFVIPFGVRSVLGFGGILPSGNLFIVILFSIPREVADMFKTLALSVKVAILPFDGKTIFM
jgi:hypothetical protein